MNPVFGFDNNRLGFHSRQSSVDRRRHRLCMLVIGMDKKKRRPACLGQPLKWICGVKAIVICDQDNGDQALCFPSNQVSIKLDQEVTFIHPLPVRNPNLESFPIQAHRFNSDMNQNFDAFIGCQSDSVPLPVNLSYLSVAWRQNPMIERIDGQTVTSHSLSENRIRYFIKWDNGAGQGGIEYEIH